MNDDGETVLTENAKEWEGWDDFLAGYIACALWSSTGDDGENLDQYDRNDLSAEALNTIEDDCAAFIFYNYRKLQRVGTMAQHGHDFWLTRNGHGAGFWDRGYGDIGDDLSNKAKTYGESNLYVSDNGKVEVGHIEPATLIEVEACPTCEAHTRNLDGIDYGGDPICQDTWHNGE